MNHRASRNYIPFPTDEWGEPGSLAAHEDNGGWGPGAGAGSLRSEGTADQEWGEPPVADGGWGAPSVPAGGWGAPTAGDWGPAPAAAIDEWGAHGSPVSMNEGVRGTKKSALKRSGAHSHSQQQPLPVPPPAQAPAPTSFHPSATAHMPQSRYGAHHAQQEWGAPDVAGWGGQASWGPQAPPKPAPGPPAAKPAWANWANEAKGMPMVNTQPAPAASYGYPTQSAAAGGGARPAVSDQQRSQILSSLLQAPNQYTKDYLSQAQAQAAHQPRREQLGSHHGRPQQQSLHPSQQWQDPHFVAEQQSILRSIQEARSQSGSHHGRPQPVQQADSWGYMTGGGGGWGERASTIPEEDEYDEEDEDDWGHDMGHDKGGYGWGGGHAPNGGRVRFSPNISYGSSPRARAQSAPSMHGVAQPQSGSQGNPQQFWAPAAMASKTMKIATGAISTTVFELPPPRNGVGEAGFVDSQGAALASAERAMYNRHRPAKERFRWGFNPDKDPRVRSLLQWIAAMSNGLATIGLKRFLETQERGALFANADFRVPAPTPGAPAQPTFDYVTLDQIQRTLDATMQESVKLYDPAFQVIVFVFLLSPSGNSMALWRRKLEVPDSVRDAYYDDILQVEAELKTYPVYVDELPVKADAPPPKKKVRFAFLRRLFGGKKSAAAS
ncbi:hypothetical protein VTO73DRAFT_14886 [Trametes versicolor]